MPICYLALGSNLGNKEKNIKLGFKKIQNLPNTQLLKTASIYETLPIGPGKQPKYLNTATKIRTELEPLELLLKLKEIEKDLGRKKRKHWGPRIIDIDILFYDNRVINTDSLIIPHPLLHRRKFVLEPLVEIEPEFKHPELEKTVSELLSDLLGHEDNKKS